jgi:endogenous inhibitor of DNA gyrase (YacG/DUF329 family)
MSEDAAPPGFTPDCPACGGSLDGVSGSVPTAADGSVLRADVDCPHCGAALQVVAESAAPDALGLDLRIERQQ